MSLATWGTALAVPVRFEIPAQPVPDAVRSFIKQADVQVTYRYDDLKASRANEVRGEMEPEAALVKLVEGTGIEISKTTDNSFALKKPAVAPASATVRGTVVRPEIGSSAGIRILVRETGQQAATDRRGDFILTNIEAGTYTLIATAEGLQTMHITDVAVRAGRELTLSRETMRKAGAVTELEPFIVRGRADEVTELDKYIVEGRKEKPFVAGNMDIPRTINDAQPYYIFDAKTIDQSGAVNVEDFLKQRLTMNTTIQTNGEMAGANLSGNTSSVNLRGVGTDKTLILVNGRRMAGVMLGTTDLQPDLNGMPLSAIERIEVLPSSASGIYGGSAIGGVVNVILKQNYTGGELRLSYDNYWATDAAKRNATLSFGMSLEGGKTHVTLNASWFDTSPLLLQDGAEIYQQNLDIIQRNAPTFIDSATTPWLGSLPNIAPSTAAMTSLTLKPAYGGTVLNSRTTHVPAGTAPGTSTPELAARLLANAGQWNRELPLSTQFFTGLLRRIGSPAETRSFRIGARRQMLPWLELTTDFSHYENKTDSIYNPVTSALLVRASAPTNPFTTDVWVRVPDATQVPNTTSSQSRSATIGAVAALPWDWTGSLDYTWSENRFDYLYYNQDTAARNNDLLNGALNPFADTLLYPLDIIKYLVPYSYQGSSRLHDFALRGAGTLPSLPWGQPTLTLGLEHRLAQTPARTETSDLPITVANSYRYTYYPRESETDSGYAEMTLPLVKSPWLPGVHALDLQLSGRSERYEVDTGTDYERTYYNRTPPTVSYGGTTLNGQPYFSKAAYNSSTYTLGFKYQPLEEVTLRVSRATAFVPPTPAQLIQNPAVREDGAIVNGSLVDTISGGNPNLQPQHSKSLNLGIIWEPQWKPLAGLRLNAEYYKIEQFGAISSLDAQTIVDQEANFPGRVVRNSSGEITLVDISMVNLYHRETEGWDLSASYSLRTSVGIFHLNAVQTIILHLKNQYAQTQPEQDAVHFPSESGAAKYKSNVTLTWERRGWSAGWTARYFGAYKQYGAAGGPGSMQYANGDVYSTTYILPQGGDTIPSQAYHDAYFGYSFGKRLSERGGSNLKAAGNRLLDGLSVQVNVRNVFDKVAPLDAFYSSSYYLSPYGGGLGSLRSYVLTVKKAF